MNSKNENQLLVDWIYKCVLLQVLTEAAIKKCFEKYVWKSSF